VTEDPAGVSVERLSLGRTGLEVSSLEEPSEEAAGTRIMSILQPCQIDRFRGWYLAIPMENWCEVLVGLE
jgi:hypothetical protein